MTGTETGTEAGDGYVRTGMSDLVVATYNIRYSGVDKGELAWKCRRDGVTETIRDVSPDVIAIQECWRDQLGDLADRLPSYEWVGYPDAAGEHTPIGFDPDRVAVDSSGAFGLAPGGERGVLGWDSSLPRRVTHAVFRCRESGDRFDVFSVHFDHRGVRSRTESARLIREKLGNCPTVVAGDLNCQPGAEPHRILTGVLDDAYTVAGGRSGPDSTYVGFGGSGAGEHETPDRKRIDYLLTRGFEAVRYEVSTAAGNSVQSSDHLLVAAGLAFSDES